MLYVSDRDRVSVSPCGSVEGGNGHGEFMQINSAYFISPPACHGSTNEDPCLSLVATLNATVMREGLCL